MSHLIYMPWALTGTTDHQPFSIQETRNPEHTHIALHIVDKDREPVFTVYAYRITSEFDKDLQQLELWDRTENLLNFFNLPNTNPTGEFS
jgi:hypothetical protein